MPSLMKEQRDDGVVPFFGVVPARAGFEWSVGLGVLNDFGPQRKLMVGRQVGIWNEEHPAEPAVLEWAEELARSHQMLVELTLPREEALELIERVKEMAAKLPDGLPQMLTGNQELRGRTR